MAAVKKAKVKRSATKAKQAKGPASATARSARKKPAVKKVAPKKSAPKKAAPKKSSPNKSRRKTMTNESTPNENAELALPDDKSLETVRDILFGAQAREHDQRTKHLEALIKTSVDKLERDFDRKIGNVEKAMAKMKEQIAKENAATAEKVAARFQDTNEQIKALDAKTASNLGDAQDQLTSDINNLEKQAKGWNEDLARQLELVQQKLQDTKADRSMLSELLASMAVAIADDKKG